jgi:hypothetical protein
MREMGFGSVNILTVREGAGTSEAVVSVARLSKDEYRGATVMCAVWHAQYANRFRIVKHCPSLPISAQAHMRQRLRVRRYPPKPTVEPR